MRDVTPAARDAQTAALQRLTPEQRFRAAMDMSNFAHRLAEAGVRLRQPDASDEEVRELLILALYGKRG